VTPTVIPIANDDQSISSIFDVGSDCNRLAGFLHPPDAPAVQLRVDGGGDAAGAVAEDVVDHRGRHDAVAEESLRRVNRTAWFPLEPTSLPGDLSDAQPVGSRRHRWRRAVVVEQQDPSEGERRWWKAILRVEGAAGVFGTVRTTWVSIIIVEMSREHPR
jgi:hypothetical protein